MSRRDGVVDRPPCEKSGRLALFPIRGRKFRRQYSIGPYVVDFYCPAEKLAVELDEETHNDPGRREYDAEREVYLRDQGIRIVRFENKEVFENLEIVLEGIAWHFRG